MVSGQVNGVQYKEVPDTSIETFSILLLLQLHV
jgi:hypothetical protein